MEEGLDGIELRLLLLHFTLVKVLLGRTQDPRVPLGLYLIMVLPFSPGTLQLPGPHTTMFIWSLFFSVLLSTLNST